MTYKEAITKAMSTIAQEENARFVGYGLRAGRAMGTLRAASEEQIVETPVAENLMTGIACGLSLNGYLPLLYFERADFLMNAADAIVNHIDKLAMLSAGRFRPGVIIRVTVGNRNKPLFTGPTHTQNFSEAFDDMCSTIVVRNITTPDQVTFCYRDALKLAMKGTSSMIFEFKDLM